MLISRARSTAIHCKSTISVWPPRRNDGLAGQAELEAGLAEEAGDEDAEAAEPVALVTRGRADRGSAEHALDRAVAGGEVLGAVR